MLNIQIDSLKIDEFGNVLGFVIIIVEANEFH